MVPVTIMQLLPITLTTLETSIEKRVEDFCEWVERDEKHSGQDDYMKMVAQIRHYWEPN